MLNLLSAVWVAFAAQTPDSVTAARFHSALASFDDTLATVRSAMASFRADLGAASPPLILQRATRVRTRCSAARAAIPTLDAVLAKDYTPQAKPRQEALRREAAQLARALDRCTREWTPMPRAAAADSLRAWGPYRVEQLEQALRRYEGRAQAFRRRAGLH